MNKIIIPLLLSIGLNASYQYKSCEQYSNELKLIPEFFELDTSINISVNDGNKTEIPYSYEKLQNLLDCASELNIPIEFNGNIQVPKTVLIKKNTTIKGNGIFWSWGNGSIMTNAVNVEYNNKGEISANHDQFKGYNGQGNIHLEGISFHGNFKKFNDSKNLIEITHAKNVIFDNVKFYEPIDTHAIDLAGSEDVNITNCKFYGFGINNEKLASFREAIQLAPVTKLGSIVGSYDGTPCHRIRIEGCYFGKTNNTRLQSSDIKSFATAIGAHGGVGDKIDSEIIIRNNQFYNTTYSGVRVMSWKNVNIVDNNFTDCNNAIKISQYGSNSGSICKAKYANINCEKNMIEEQIHCKDGKKSCLGGGRGSENILIEHNIFKYTNTFNGKNIFYNNLQYYTKPLTDSINIKTYEPDSINDFDIVYEKNFKFINNIIINNSNKTLNFKAQGTRKFIFDSNKVIVGKVRHIFYNFKGINRPTVINNTGFINGVDYGVQKPKYAPIYSRTFNEDINDTTIKIEASYLEELYSNSNQYNSYHSYKHDLNLDGIADIFITKGEYASFWAMNENGTHSWKYISRMTHYNFVNIADFDADGLSDILLYDKNTRATAIWYMKTNGKREHYYIGKIADGYTISGTGDFNGDGRADILLTKNHNSYWIEIKSKAEMKNSRGILSSKFIGNIYSYSVIDTGDFDNNGISDIVLFYPPSGKITIQYINEYGKGHNKRLAQNLTYEAIVGVEDFNGDGITDILWKKNNTYHLWYMDINGGHQYKSIGSQDLSYTIIGSADYNGDGISDILWKKDLNIYIWYMNENGVKRKVNIGKIYSNQHKIY